MSTESLKGATKHYSPDNVASSGNGNNKNERLSSFHGMQTSLAEAQEGALLEKNSSVDSRIYPDYERYHQTVREVELNPGIEAGITDFDPTGEIRVVYGVGSIAEKIHTNPDKKASEPQVSGAEGGVEVKVESKTPEGITEDLDMSDDDSKLIESSKLKGRESRFIIILAMMRKSMEIGLSKMEKQGRFDTHIGPPLCSNNLHDTDYSVSHRREAFIETCCTIVKKALNFGFAIGHIFKEHKVSEIVKKLNDAQKKVDKCAVDRASDEDFQGPRQEVRAKPFKGLIFKAATFFGKMYQSPEQIIEEQKKKMDGLNRSLDKIKGLLLELDPLLIMYPGIRVYLKKADLKIKTCFLDYDKTLQMKMVCNLTLEVEVPSFDGEDKKGITACLFLHDIQFSCNAWLAELITRFLQLGGDLNFMPALATNIMGRLRSLGENLNQDIECLYQINIGSLDLTINGVNESHHARLFLEKLKIDMEHKYGRGSPQHVVCDVTFGKTSVEALGDFGRFVCDLSNQVAFITREISTYTLDYEKITQRENVRIRDNLRFTTDFCARLGYLAGHHLPKLMVVSVDETKFRGEWTCADLKENREFISISKAHGLVIAMMNDPSSEPAVKLTVESFISTAQEDLTEDVTVSCEHRSSNEEKDFTAVKKYHHNVSVNSVELKFNAKTAAGLIDFSVAMLLVQDKKLFNRVMFSEYDERDREIIHRYREYTIELQEYIAGLLKRENDDLMTAIKVSHISDDVWGGYFKDYTAYAFADNRVHAKNILLENSGRLQGDKAFEVDEMYAQWLTKSDSFGTEISLLKPVAMSLKHGSTNSIEDGVTGVFSFGLYEYGIEFVQFFESYAKEAPVGLIRSKLTELHGLIFHGTVNVLDAYGK